jgi:hypothetical protein
MFDRLDNGGALRRPLPRLSPINDGERSEAGFRIMVCEQFRLRLRRLWELLLQRFGDPPVLNPPARSKQRLVGRILDQLLCLNLW